MIDEKSFSCPFFRHFFLFQWDLLFFCFGPTWFNLLKLLKFTDCQDSPRNFHHILLLSVLPIATCFFRVHRSTVQKNGNPRNYRRLLGDLHWPYDTDFVDYSKSWWKGFGLICLRTGVFVFLVQGSFFIGAQFFFGDLTCLLFFVQIHCSDSWFIIITWYHKIEVMVSFSTSSDPTSMYHVKLVVFQWTCIIAEHSPNLHKTCRTFRKCLFRWCSLLKIVWVVATHIFFIFTPIWGKDPIWLLFFKGVETTN